MCTPFVGKPPRDKLGFKLGSLVQLGPLKREVPSLNRVNQHIGLSHGVATDRPIKWGSNCRNESWVHRLIGSLGHVESLAHWVCWLADGGGVCHWVCVRFSQRALLYTTHPLRKFFYIIPGNYTTGNYEKT